MTRSASSAEEDWDALWRQLCAASAEHEAAHRNAVNQLIHLSRNHYDREIDDFVNRIATHSAATVQLAPMLDAARAYLSWMHWVAWNAANLAPLIEGDLARAAQRLALGTLAYAAGRLVDDGLDGHLSFKEKKQSLVGALAAVRSEQGAIADARAESVFFGMLVYRRASERLRIECPSVSDTLQAMFDEISAAVLDELHAGPQSATSSYRRIIRGKAVLYNMLLYRPLLCDTRAWRVLRILYEMDELAQLVNDFNDFPEDSVAGRPNAVVVGLYELADARVSFHKRLGRLWQRASRLEPPARWVMAAMLQNLGIDRLGALPATPPPPGTDRAIARGLEWLQRAQCRSGEFRLAYSTVSSMTHPVYCESPFATAMIVAALEPLHYPEINHMIRSAVYWLATWRRPDGWFTFLRQGIDPDVDDTSLISTILQRHDAAPSEYSDIAMEIASWPRRDGLLVTWRRPAGTTANDVDPCVSANALRLLKQNGLVAHDLERALGHALRDETHANGTLYYESPAALPYLLSVIPDSRERVADANTWSERVSYLLAHASSINDLAMTVTLVTRVSSASDPRASRIVAELVSRLREAQQPDGSWRAHAMFRAFNFWGGPELTTALVIEALACHAAWGGDGPIRDRAVARG